MTKTDYLAALEKYLKTLPEADYKEAMDYFTEYFEEAGPENEAQVIEELGDPKDAAEEIIRSLSSNQAEEMSTRPQHQSSAHNHQSYTDNAYIFEDYATISELHIDVTTQDILIEPSPDDFFHIKYYNGKGNNQIISTVQNEKWHITEKGNTHYSVLDWIINVMKNGFDNHPI